MISSARSTMPTRLSEPNRILAPRRSIRSSATSWGLAAVLHGLVLILILFLFTPAREPRSTTIIPLLDSSGGLVPSGAARAENRPASSATRPAGAPRTSGLPGPRAADDEAEDVLIVEVPVGGGSTTPSTPTTSAAGLTALRASTMPLVSTGYGIGRRTVARDEGRIARMRAESLINAAIASVVDVKPPLKAGPFGFPAGGGVSIPIPWGGFVRDDRDDERWREERCRGKDDGKADKPGEAEARRGRCS